MVQPVGRFADEKGHSLGSAGVLSFVVSVFPPSALMMLLSSVHRGCFAKLPPTKGQKNSQKINQVPYRTMVITHTAICLWANRVESIVPASTSTYLYRPPDKLLIRKRKGDGGREIGAGALLNSLKILRCQQK